jgi:hypothetical protein
MKMRQARTDIFGGLSKGNLLERGTHVGKKNGFDPKNDWLNKGRYGSDKWVHA